MRNFRLVFSLMKGLTCGQGQSHRAENQIGHFIGWFYFILFLVWLCLFVFTLFIYFFVSGFLLCFEKAPDLIFFFFDTELDLAFLKL